MNNRYATNGTFSAASGVQIRVIWPASAVVTGAGQLLELSGAFTFEGKLMNGLVTFILSAAQPGNTGRVISCAGFAPPTIVNARPGSEGLVTFPANCVLAWTGGLGGPFTGLQLRAPGFLGLAA